MLTMAELSELLERNRRRDAELLDRTIAAAARLQSEFDKMLAEMRASNYRFLADRRDDDQKDHDEEERGDYR